jgi:hypothetical protein
VRSRGNVHEVAGDWRGLLSTGTGSATAGRARDRALRPLPLLRLRDPPGKVAPSPLTTLLTERSIINFLVWTAGLIAAPYIAVSAIYGNFVPFGVVLGIAVVAWILGILKDGICLLPLIGTFCGGRFTFLPLKVSPFELSLLAVIGYYLIFYLAVRRKLVRVGPWALAVPILVIAAIIMSDEPNFGVRVMGGGREGGSGSLFIIISAIAYICGVSIVSPSVWLLSRLPIVCAVAACIFAIPYFATTYFPGTAPFFYLFSEDINSSAYSADVLNSGGIIRNADQAQVGLAVLTCAMAYYPITTWWQPKRVGLVLLGGACIAAVIMGGFRNLLFSYGLEIALLAACHIRWRALLILPTLALGAIMLAAAHTSHLITLPTSAQRTIDFLPGDWDPEVVANTDGSNEFRTRIIHVYLDEYASAHPWLGNGISYDSADFALYNFLAQTQPTADGYWQSKIFITDKVFHTGWVSVYDAVGLVGSFFFVFGFGAAIYLTGRSVLGKNCDRRSPFFPVKCWLFAYTTTKVAEFFVTYGDLKLTFPVLCSICIVWYHINRVETLGPEVMSRRRILFEPERTHVAVSA